MKKFKFIKEGGFNLDTDDEIYLPESSIIKSDNIEEAKKEFKNYNDFAFYEDLFEDKIRVWLRSSKEKVAFYKIKEENNMKLNNTKIKDETNPIKLKNLNNKTPFKYGDKLFIKISVIPNTDRDTHNIKCFSIEDAEEYHLKSNLFIRPVNLEINYHY